VANPGSVGDRSSKLPAGMILNCGASEPKWWMKVTLWRVKEFAIDSRLHLLKPILTTYLRENRCDLAKRRSQLLNNLTARYDLPLTLDPLSIGSVIIDITVSSLSWIATDRCSKVTEMTKCILFSSTLIIPRIPAKGPVSMSAIIPLGRYFHGFRNKLLCARSCNDSISSLATSAGVPPKPTILVTPRVEIAFPSAEALKRQKTYPANRGKSISTTRSDHFRFNR
jgi:hypothetical protein